MVNREPLHELTGESGLDVSHLGPPLPIAFRSHAVDPPPPGPRSALQQLSVQQSPKGTGHGLLCVSVSDLPAGSASHPGLCSAMRRIKDTSDVGSVVHV